MRFAVAIVRSRARDRGLRRDTLAVLAGGTTTVAPRAPANAVGPKEIRPSLAPVTSDETSHMPFLAGC